MKYEYLRVELIRLIEYGEEINWLHTAANCEYREDYCCFFVLKGSPTHTKIALLYGDVFES